MASLLLITMAKIIQTSDFKGRYSIAKNGYSEDGIQEYIDYYEPIYITQLLGAELGEAFLDDITNGAPVDPLFLVLFDPFRVDDNNCIRVSDGIKQMLLGFCFFEITNKAIDAKRNLAGNTRDVQDNAMSLSQIGAQLWKWYNVSAETAQNIQWYICENDEDYPTFNGQKFELISWL